MNIASDDSRTVTYDGNGHTSGTAPTDSNIYVAGQKATILGNSGALGKEGHSLASWNLAADGEGEAYHAGEQITIGTDNIILFADWDANEYEISFDPNGGEGSMPRQALAYMSTSPLDTNKFTKDGYSFIGWLTEADGTSIAFADGANYTMPAGNVTLYAAWSNNTYTVTFDANGGQGSMARQKMGYGIPANLLHNQFSYVGHTFLGWSTESASPTAEYEDADSYSIGSSDTTLYAIWSLDRHTITFYPNGGSGTMDVQTGEYGQTIQLSANAFTNAGFHFAGWSTSQYSAIQYADGASITIGLSDVRLYAHWGYRLFYDGNGNTGGSIPVDGAFYSSGNIATVTFPDPSSVTKPGYQFAGWNTRSDALGTSYVDDSLLAPRHLTITGDVTLYAIWIDEIYSISIVAFGSATTETIAGNYITGLKTGASLPSGHLTFPNGVLEVSMSTTANSTVTSVSFPPNLRVISQYCFSQFSALSSATIPSSVTYIGPHAFNNGSAFTDVYMEREIPPTLETAAFPTGVTVHVPATALSAYQANASWNVYAIVSP